MGQQPNLEFDESDLPRRSLEPAPARRWRPTKAGLVTSPDDMPGGGLHGMIGPDPGWAARIVNLFELPDDDPDLRSVVTGLVMARAASLGRAAVKEDIEVALSLCGYDKGSPQYLQERRARWLAAASHDKRPGQTAVSEVDRDLLTKAPDQIRSVLRRPKTSKPQNDTG